jgi:colanic acid/amylovoran biosynthesis glycosyltransferase
MPSDAKIGYVVKMYPRFSETFIVTELLAMQSIGVDCEIFSLRPPADPRFHASLAQVSAPVSYLRSEGLRAADLWTLLGTARAELSSLADHIDELLRADVRDAAQAVQLALLVRRRGITHLHAHFASVATTVARLAARLAGVTYSLTAHAKDIFHSEVDADELRRKLADADSVVTVSRYNLQHLRDTFGADAARVRLVYNGLDLDEFGYSEPLDRPPVIAAVGRLVEKKGFDDLLTAVALLREQDRPVRLELVGTGLLEDALAAQVVELGLQDVVTLHGALPQEEVRRIVRGAAVFAAPCVVAEDGNRDGLPTVVLEAMALGTPCVATPVTGIPEVVTDGVTGLLVPERDPAALAAALARVLDHPELAGSLTKAARSLIEAEFDARHQARAVAEGFHLSGTIRTEGGDHA